MYNVYFDITKSSACNTFSSDKLQDDTEKSQVIICQFNE